MSFPCTNVSVLQRIYHRQFDVPVPASIIFEKNIVHFPISLHGFQCRRKTGEMRHTHVIFPLLNYHKHHHRKEASTMPFTEICIYQVKPQKTEEFEALMLTAKSFLEEQEGLLALRLVRRGYHIDLAQIKEGLPPLKLTRIVKSVKYMLYWEFDTKENYGLAQKNLYDSYWKAIEKCLVVPHDKYLGEVIF